MSRNIYFKLLWQHSHLLLAELSSKSDPGLKLEDLLKKKLEVLPKIQVSHQEGDDQLEHVSFFNAKAQYLSFLKSNNFSMLVSWLRLCLLLVSSVFVNCLQDFIPNECVLQDTPDLSSPFGHIQTHFLLKACLAWTLWVEMVNQSHSSEMYKQKPPFTGEVLCVHHGANKHHPGVNV